MAKTAQWIGRLAALFIVGLACYFIYLLVISSDQTRLAVLTAAVSVGTLVYTQNRNTKREIESRQFSKKAEAYEEVISSMAFLMDASRRGEEVDQNQLMNRLAAVVPKMMIWAGPPVLQAWERLSTPSDDPLKAVTDGADLITALRRELGHTDDSSLGHLGALRVMLRHDARAEFEKARYRTP